MRTGELFLSDGVIDCDGRGKTRTRQLNGSVELVRGVGFVEKLQMGRVNCT